MAIVEVMLVVRCAGPPLGGQMPWATAYSDSAKVEQVSGRNYKAAERDNWRFKVGYSF